MNLNLVDYVIILIVLFYAVEGFGLGFIAALLDLVSFMVSFAAGLSLYSYFGKFLFTTFNIPSGFANAGGFFIAAFLLEIISSSVLRSLFRGVSVKKLSPRLDGILGSILSALSGILLITFILTMALTLPLSSFIKHNVSESRIAKVLTSNTQGLAKSINGVFGQAVNETLTFMTVEPKSNESLSLNFQTNNFTIDQGAEAEMLADVNKERTSRGIRPLVLGSDRLIGVARDHCEDMFRRGYFSHYTPEGLSPFDRMQNAGITFNFAGENLALAPNEQLAMQGLMQSPGHRENILSPNFGRVGIGAIDGGAYGEMFCQEFTD